MAIRLASPEDAAEVTRIYNEAIAERIATADTEPRSVEDRRAWMAQFGGAYPLWVDERDGRLASYGGLNRYSPRDGYRFAVEDFVYVSADARGQGYGRAMLEHVLAEARKLGMRYVLARIFAHNKASIQLHAAFGFRDLGIQRNIVLLDVKWHDVILMDLALD